MDVKEIQAGALSGLAGKRGKQEEAGGVEFQKVLQQAQSSRKPIEGMDSDRIPSVGGAEIHAGPALSISSAPFIPGLAGTSTVQAEGTLASERTLALLERYQVAMADSNRPLQEIRGVVQSLSAELDELTERAGKLSPSDPLQKIMTAIGVLSSVEIEKFNRGDYS
jgi:hypothetical protein